MDIYPGGPNGAEQPLQLRSQPGNPNSPLRPILFIAHNAVLTADTLQNTFGWHMGALPHVVAVLDTTALACSAGHVPQNQGMSLAYLVNHMQMRDIKLYNSGN